MRNLYLVAALCSIFILSACSSEPSDNLQKSIVESTAISNFDPANSVIPFPNDLLFSGTTDGTLNIPVVNAADLSDPQVALNGVDGFSTIAPFTTGFTGPILGSSVNGNTVRVYPVTLISTPGGPISGFSPRLTYGVDYVASVSSVDSSGSTLTIQPLRPLNPKSSYYVVVTNGLKSSDGNQMGVSGAYTFAKLTTPLQVGGVSQFPALTDAQAVALDPLRALVNFNEGAVETFDAGVDADDIILSWSFTTQSITDVLNQVRFLARSSVPPTSLAAAPTGLVDSPLGLADIYVGTISVPYYLAAAASVNDPSPLASFWQDGAGNDLTSLIPGRLTPASTGNQSIPLMVSVPKAGQPSTYPIVIYQHGITTNRATMLAIADAFALAGFAVAAIDLPLHGLTGNETDGSQFYQGLGGGTERTFDLDLVTQNPTTGDITLAAPDGITDSSGRHFVNLTNLLNTRDNLRQSISDLFALTYAIRANSLTAGANGFDVNRIYFVGHSLGAIVGTPFAALEPDVRDAVFVFGGGGIPKILDGSASFSPSIVAGLAAAGVSKGTADYESFLGAAQALVDSADPVNHASSLAAKGAGILFFEMVGGNSSPSDLVVPNRVPDGNDSSNTVAAPLAGTEPLLGLLGLSQVNTSQGPGVDLRHSVKFVVGNHGSLLSAAADPFNSAATNAAVRAEIQSIAAAFVANDGAVVSISDNTLLQSP
ncbi:MAG: Ig-like domain-containing protein [Gammaproteobacteria bacterium]|nr:Ig-like domain-containing protein [Gammaproteobacteria bacterium]